MPEKYRLKKDYDRKEASMELDAWIEKVIANTRLMPLGFNRTRDLYGTVGVIERMVERMDLIDGFVKVMEFKDIEWSLEQAVLKFPTEFRPLTVKAAEYKVALARHMNTPEGQAERGQDLRKSLRSGAVPGKATKPRKAA